MLPGSGNGFCMSMFAAWTPSIKPDGVYPNSVWSIAFAVDIHP
jgi:hypothetical protein